MSRALNAGRAGAAAELVGVAAGAGDMTVDYLKQRKQFGKLIGEFQALQHRAAHLYGEIEIARAAALKAAQLLDARRRQGRAVGLGRQGQGRPVSALAVQEGVQMHGGIGMTDEHDIGLYMKREAVLSELFGDARASTPTAWRSSAATERSSRKLIRAEAIGRRGSPCQANASTLAIRLPSRSISASAKVSPGSAAHIVDRHGDRLHLDRRRRRSLDPAR